MKKNLVFTGTAILAAFLCTTLLGWSFWLVLIATGLGAITLALCESEQYKKYTKWPTRILIGYGLLLLGGYLFSGTLPLSRGVLSRVIIRRDAQVALQANDGLGKVSTAIATRLAIEGELLATNVYKLLATNGPPEDITNALKEFRIRWATIKAGLDPVPPPPPPKPAKASSVGPTLPGKTLEVNLTNGQVYAVDDLRQGQHWRYTAFNGAFSHRIDKGDDSACWKMVDNNLPWNADCAGQLQVKAGNVPVKMTVNIAP
ncbi:MAG: hypothetical protein PHS62_03315 [Patescibacteria group bacterium]|nr:hypothetical protein [Patescibacteria group bacterium]